MTTICLAMMVKNEAHVIERCLDSVRGLVDHWIVVDTGSTDGTADIVRRVLTDVPGSLYHRPWVDYAHNRTEVVQAARVTSDYTLLIDADDVLETPNGFTWPELTADLIEVVHRRENLSSRRAMLLSNRLSWHFDGVRDEALHAPHQVTSAVLNGVLVRQHSDGGRMLGRSFAAVRGEDALVLLEAAQRQPDNAGYQYHLARAYRDSGQHAEALEAFARRAAMGGNAEEVADSLLQLAHQLIHTGAGADTVAGAYLGAWDYRPSRAEPLVALARYAREHGKFSVARMAATQARALPRPDDLLRVDEDVYAWRRHDEFAVSAYWTGDYAACAEVCRELLAGGQLPESQRDRVEGNLRHAEAALAIVSVETPSVGPSLPRQRSSGDATPLRAPWEATWSPAGASAPTEPARLLISTRRDLGITGE